MKNLNLELVKELNNNVINQLINDFENGFYSHFIDDYNFPEFLHKSLLDEIFLFELICKYSIVDDSNYEDYNFEFPIDEIKLNVSDFLSILFQRYEKKIYN